MPSEDDIARWRLEFLEDDAAIALLRERILELGFGIAAESVDRRPLDDLGQTTEIRLRLTRLRRMEGNTVRLAKSDVSGKIALIEALGALPSIRW